MQITNEYQAKYIARVLSSFRGSGVERLSAILADSKVDLNPHQIAAAVFALSNPFSKGLILADEVGLGKTIEAGIIIAQKWAEEKRSIIVVVPSMLKRQWSAELEDKFYLPTRIVDSGELPQDNKAITIVSYNYAYLHELELRQKKWDMAVLDEAHKLRNVYLGNVMAESIKATFTDTYKLLLTATPLQNSLLELYGLVSIIDDNIFGDLESFKNNYVFKDNSKELAERLKNICTRTLRRQVAEFIRYTDRYSVTQEFSLTEGEQWLYESVTEYVYERSKVLKGLPKHLIGIMLLKCLSSSPASLSTTLTKLQTTLKIALENKHREISISIEDASEQDAEQAPEHYKLAVTDTQGLVEEIEQLEYIIGAAEIIKEPSKATALVEALSVGFENLSKLGAKQKAVIFTERLKTQEFLHMFLQRHGYKQKDIQIINGSSQKRDEIVKAFESDVKILISTEVGGEGLNLQFCSMVVNYDLPWNPQRIEQRIGRCHRYGQKHDVAVVNFLSKNNYVEHRLYELLSHKLKLFEGMFGSSDTVLGIIEDVDFEKRIAEIYLNCRTEQQIQEAFEALQSDLEAHIKESRDSAKRQVFEYLDADVAQRLKIANNEATAAMDKTERLLWEFTKYKLNGWAYLDDTPPPSIVMHKNYYKKKRINSLIFRMDKNETASQRYRLNCPLASELIFDAIYRMANNTARLTFDLKNNPKVSALEKYKGKRGLLGLFAITKVGEFIPCDFMLFGIDSSGQPLNEELCEKLLLLNACNINRSFDEEDDDGKKIGVREVVEEKDCEYLVRCFDENLPDYAAKMREVVVRYFDEKTAALDKWANDKKQNIERRLKEFDRKIDALKTESQKERDFSKKLKLLEQIKALEKERAARRLKAYEEQDKVCSERDALVTDAKKQLEGSYKGKPEFIIEWEIKE